MRTTILAAILALAPACIVGTGDVTGTSGTGGGMGSNPGSGSGSDPGSGSGSNPQPPPKLDASIDKPTVNIELGKTDVVTVSLTASGGFSGTVNIAPTLVDASMNPITSVNIQAQPAAVLTADGTATVPITIQVPPNATGTTLDATLNIAITGGPDPLALSSAVNVSNIFTVVYPDGAGSDVSKHPLVGANISIKRGAIIRFKNEDTTPGAQHITHGGPLFPHESTASTSGLFGDVYDVPTTPYAPGSVGQLGCHDHEDGSTYITFTIQ